MRLLPAQCPHAGRYEAPFQRTMFASGGGADDKLAVLPKAVRIAQTGYD